MGRGCGPITLDSMQDVDYGGGVIEGSPGLRRYWNVASSRDGLYALANGFIYKNTKNEQTIISTKKSQICAYFAYV
jgi:hypothetical protein